MWFKRKPTPELSESFNSPEGISTLLYGILGVWATEFTASEQKTDEAACVLWALFNGHVRWARFVGVNVVTMYRIVLTNAAGMLKTDPLSLLGRMTTSDGTELAESMEGTVYHGMHINPKMSYDLTIRLIELTKRMIENNKRKM